MNVENRATKLYLKSKSPKEVMDLLELYEIPSPYKEVLITVCIHNKEGYSGVDFLSENFNINLSYWTFVRRVKESLHKFKVAHDYHVCQ